MPSAEELKKVAVLGRMRLIAGGLLVVMALAYGGARYGKIFHPWLAYVEAFAEAAMVGGLADWFAVTALFRRPLGLPIPHTAIVPRNKDRIGVAVGNFVTNNFLSPDVVITKLRAFDIAARLAAWLDQPGRAEAMARKGVVLLDPMLASLDDEPWRRMLGRVALKRLQAMPAGPLLARMLRVLVAGGQHLVLFDLALASASGFLEENDQSIRQTIAAKSSWWVPEWVDARLAGKIIAGISETLAAMSTPGHPWRERFEESVTEAIGRLAEGEEAREKAEAIKAQVLAHPEVQAYLAALWDEMKLAIGQNMQAGGGVERALARLLAGMAKRLKEDEALQLAVNDWTRRACLRLIVPNRGAIGSFMTGVVRNWDSRTLVAKLELQFGRDLQYIRLNGTLVGGLVGLAIHVAGQFWPA